MKQLGCSYSLIKVFPHDKAHQFVDIIYNFMNQNYPNKSLHITSIILQSPMLLQTD